MGWATLIIATWLIAVLLSVYLGRHLGSMEPTTLPEACVKGVIRTAILAIFVVLVAVGLTVLALS